MLRSCLFISLLALAGCTRTPAPPPPIHRAPVEIAALRVFVINASYSAAEAANETTVTGYTIQMRQAVQRSLNRAGFTVVIAPNVPTDLLAKIDVESPSLDKPGMASMTLATPDGVVVEQVSELVILDEHVDIDERGPVGIVERMARSPRIAAFARGHQRGNCEKVDVPARKVLEVPAEGN
jgi:hypothetical protein